MSSPSALIKVNYLVMRRLYFRGVRGDLQEGHDYGKRLGGYDKLLHDYASRWQFLSSQCQFLPSRSPLTSSRAQNWGFCALLPSETPIFGHSEHKIEVFVRFLPPKPSFSGISSTKLAFLCSCSWESSIEKPENKCIHLDIIPDRDSLAKRQPHPASNICAPARQHPHSAERRRWRRQSVQMGRQICVCLSSSNPVDRYNLADRPFQRSGNSPAQTSASLHPPAALRLRVLPFTRT